MTGFRCQGCVLCRLRDVGQLTWAEQLRSPRRLHLEAEAALGVMLARRVLHSKPTRLVDGTLNLGWSLLNRRRPHDRTRCLARQVLHTHDCPMRQQRQWPAIITPDDPGPAA